MSEREMTGRTIRVMHMGDQSLVVVLGINELQGLDGNDSMITGYQIGDDGHGMYLYVSTRREKDEHFRRFQVYFDKDAHKFALKEMAKGARIAFTSAPSAFTGHVTTAMERGDFLAVINEYGACHIDLLPREIVTIKEVFGV